MISRSKRSLKGPVLASPALALGLSACISTVTPPEPTAQVDVPYGPRVYLKDATIGKTPSVCRSLGAITTKTASITYRDIRDGQIKTGTIAVPDTVGGDVIMDPAKAYNCYVEVAEDTLKADVIEVTNDLFQLCVDSTVCKKPDPNDVERAPLCRSEDSFGTCPVVSVTRSEADRFCGFVGRRLPSMLEHLIMRQGNQPQRPADVMAFAYGDDAPASCEQAVLKDCAKPYPMSVELEGETRGAATLDKTIQGVYDLTGNASEWASDLLPALRGPATELPWFCVRPIPTSSASQLPECPEGEVCIRGEYTVRTSSLAIPDRRADFPVCVASQTLAITNGAVGSVMGGNYAVSEPTEASAGLFARILVDAPDADPADRSHGFRCVGEAGIPSGILPR
ncbi:MAG: SUMF1/EgtB/PvdO family nonheme iron enzyme [Deltaproteobacteria bacterium]|nr:SUMF1/EgtB/PvdO family nonheme iron enzyme [Deltaproteobacteria bacterium]